MKLSIAIIDDTNTDIKTLNKHLIDWAEEQDHLLSVDQFNTPNTVLEHTDLRFDIMFVDVMLGEGRLGTDFIREFRAKMTHNDPLIVLMSSEHSYMKAGYGIEAFDFVCKPYESKDIKEIMDRAVSRLQVKTDEMYTVTVKGTIYNISCSDILFITVSRNYATVHTSKTTYRFRRTVSKLIEELPNYFVQSSGNTVINITAATSISPTEVTFGDYEHKAPITKTYYNNIRKMFRKS